MTAKQSKRATQKQKGESIFAFFHNEIERMNHLCRYRASESCRSTLNALMTFNKNHDITFDMMDSELMEQFEAHLRQRGLTRNTTSYYIRCIRSVYNRAVERGLTDDRHPFRHVYTSKDKTVKRALGLEWLQAIKRLNLSSTPSLDLARDLFLFSLYTRGMSFVDMAYLRKSDLQGGMLLYRRRKTGQLLCIEWMPCMEQIARKYHRPQSPYLLPIITDNEADERKQYLSSMRSMNRNLKKVGTMVNLPVQLSSYYARHTWASLAHSMNIPIAVISEALGHNSEATTLIYLNNIQSNIVNSANRRLLDTLGASV